MLHTWLWCRPWHCKHHDRLGVVVQQGMLDIRMMNLQLAHLMQAQH